MSKEWLNYGDVTCLFVSEQQGWVAAEPLSEVPVVHAASPVPRNVRDCRFAVRIQHQYAAHKAWRKQLRRSQEGGCCAAAWLSCGGRDGAGRSGG